MHVEWKIVTGDEKIKRICKTVLHMRHQPEACASDLGDDQSHYLFCYTKLECSVSFYVIIGATGMS